MNFSQFAPTHLVQFHFSHTISHDHEKFPLCSPQRHDCTLVLLFRCFWYGIIPCPSEHKKVSLVCLFSFVMLLHKVLNRLTPNQTDSVHPHIIVPKTQLPETRPSNKHILFSYFDDLADIHVFGTLPILRRHRWGNSSLHKDPKRHRFPCFPDAFYIQAVRIITIYSPLSLFRCGTFNNPYFSTFG